MPFILIIIGAAIMISALRGQAGNLGKQIASDFTGSGSFLVWIGALFGVGAIGYAKPLKPFSDGLLALILLSFVLKNAGLFNKLQSAFASAPASLPSMPVTNTSGVTGASDLSSAIVTDVISTVGSLA